MSVWAIGTQLAIWTLLIGSVLVFGWFLAEVTRLARKHGSSGGEDPASEEPEQHGA